MFFKKGDGTKPRYLHMFFKKGNGGLWEYAVYFDY